MAEQIKPMSEPLEDAILHCGSVYHIARLKGKGKDYALSLYELSMRVAYKTGRFRPRMTALALYLDCHRNQLYNAAALLVGSGFWVVVEEVLGTATHYRPLDHKDWVAADFARAEATCCKKMEMPWDGEEQDQLAQQLYGITGGVKFYTNQLTGMRNHGLSDAEICEHTKAFMGSPAYAHTHDRANLSNRLPVVRDKAFRTALAAFIKEASKN